ncbi:MAG TPA: NADH-quinone oxidoreductase subunit NuoK [Polyangiaceae bacterium LLY-WYZ-15_(1-7)]|nr:NADH-quinone oxidoreductase subunit NuoK [Myxococcales bacterium]MAT27866.1 NADH-quinone oxidoreductase subunit NuoK [Sandaracinus sp.]HJK93588.1 NADH-quinone oxidoreductase subunit NuoK [Polyangiaceae bacterium LLY-WYZ-15_(1-7)]MBJ71745.1 NADH-quinone oxidoreductase subunit NuoK [Sandaracinus sp.]HJL05878.1 NADH-quinone oxidoreductase subunit NuoK [Polyangiaceae bacterium LLY-WYZ-15_(1-7)]
MEIGLGEYLALASLLFGIGATGFLTRRNALIQLMSIEIMLNSVNVVLVAVNRFHPENHAGQIFSFFVIAVAAAEAAVGLAILIALYRLKKTIETDKADVLRH